ncbi:MAG: tetratricopeptide repeat protein [Myxococcota bacterium]
MTVTPSQEPRSTAKSNDVITRVVGFTLVVAAAVGFWWRARSQATGTDEALHNAKTIETRLRALEREHTAQRVASECRASSCDCIRAAVRAELDLDNVNQAQIMLKHPPASCEAALAGARAELAARRGEHAAARTAAEKALARDPQDGFALYALAADAYRSGRRSEALDFAVRASSANRGSASLCLEALIALENGELPRAERALRRALELEPNDTAALANLGLVAQRQNRYLDARETYLKVTRLDPRHKDARYNLALLTQSVGARAEAEHHLTKFEKIAPNDERLPRLRTLIAQTPANPSMVAARAGASAAAAPSAAPTAP